MNFEKRLEQRITKKLDQQVPNPYKRKRFPLWAKIMIPVTAVTAAVAVPIIIMNSQNMMEMLINQISGSTIDMNGVAGFGFLALAVMIFGQWKPFRIALAALLFGLFRALSNVYIGIGFLNSLNIPSTVYNMMPYIISLIVLAFTSKSSKAPKAEGIPYDKGQRSVYTPIRK